MPENNATISLVRRGISDPARLYPAVTRRLRSLGWRDSFPVASHAVRQRASRILISNAALSFWTSAGRRDPAFGPIYSEREISGRRPRAIDTPQTDDAPAPSDEVPKAASPQLPTKPAGRRRAINELVDGVQELGFGLLEDFLPDSTMQAVREEFDSLPAEPNAMMGNGAALYSLLLTYTNGPHRRTPFGTTAAQGSFRESAMFMFYDEYTRRDLLANLFRR